MEGVGSEEHADGKVRVKTKKSVTKLVEKAPESVEDAFFDMIEKVQGMTLEQVWADNGLDLEKDQSRKKSGIHTMRITKGWRVLCLLRTGSIIEIFGIKNPTEAHSVRRRH